uniref:Uncharacterized protein n=1 Tax=Rangifer tarandus platyrhynchus TaxID=3082113 RepID=A0ACB0EY61_RANTA|nr:unnamed protein product [Rangifer tarandus platyrhynchus]
MLSGGYGLVLWPRSRSPLLGVCSEARGPQVSWLLSRVSLSLRTVRRLLALPAEGDGRRPSTASRWAETPASRGRAGRLGRQGTDTVLNDGSLRAAATPPAGRGGPRASGLELLQHVRRTLPVRHQGRLWQRRDVHSTSRSCSRGTFTGANQAPDDASSRRRRAGPRGAGSGGAPDRPRARGRRKAPMGGRGSTAARGPGPTTATAPEEARVELAAAVGGVAGAGTSLRPLEREAEGHVLV